MNRCANCDDVLPYMESDLCPECEDLDPSQHSHACSCQVCEPDTGDESDQDYWRRRSADGRPM